MPTLPILLAAPADSARAVADLYNTSLVATLPVLVASALALLLHRSTAGTRTIVWRCAIITIFAVGAGRLLSPQWIVWVLPEPLTRPLVALGSVQLVNAPDPTGATPASDLTRGLQALLALYWAGVAVVLLPTCRARLRLLHWKRRAIALDTPLWRARIRDAGARIGVPPDSIRLLGSPVAAVPMTWGVTRPVILLPMDSLGWCAGAVQATLRHELAHVRGRDAPTLLLARITCALFWFHPGVWWLARRFEADAEEACDDRVLMTGIRPSDYAEWLAAAARSPGWRGLDMTMALARTRGLRSRLHVVTNTQRRLSIPSRRAVLCAAAITSVAAIPLATVQLAPTRSALTSLMEAPRWESRAWAVVRLAKRADSVDVARSAARHDPDPAVRAWARYALGLSQATPAPRSGS